MQIKKYLDDMSFIAELLMYKDYVLDMMLITKVEGNTTITYEVYKQNGEQISEKSCYDDFSEALRRFADYAEIVDKGIIKVTPTDLANDLLFFVNGHNETSRKDVKTFIHAITVNGHRVLQNSLFSLIMELINAWANLDSYDIRNQLVVEKCKKIIEKQEEIKNAER